MGEYNDGAALTVTKAGPDETAVPAELVRVPPEPTVPLVCGKPEEEPYGGFGAAVDPELPAP